MELEPQFRIGGAVQARLYRRRPAVVARLVAFAIFLAAAATGVVSPAQGAPNVVATIPPLHSLAAAIMSGRGAPRLLLSGGTSPHIHSLKPSQARMLREADAILWIDPGIESFLPRNLKAIGPGVRALALADVPGLVQHPQRVHRWGLSEAVAADAPGAGHDHDDHHDHGKGKDHDKGHGHGHGHHHGGPGTADAHVWLDPVNARAMAMAIRDLLSEIDPPGQAHYRANTEALIARLDRLRDDLAARLAPVRGRAFVVMHDAYQYFERRFGLQSAGALTLDPDRPPGAQHVRALRRRIVAGEVACVMSEPQFPARLIDTLIEGTGARQGVLDPLGAGHVSGPDLYFTLLTDNARALVDCLTRPN